MWLRLLLGCWCGIIPRLWLNLQTMQMHILKKKDCEGELKPCFNYEDKHRTAVIFVGAVYGWDRVWKWQRDVLQRQSMCVYAVCYQIRFCLIETLWEDWGLWPLRLENTRPSSVELCQIDTVCHRLLLYLCFLTTAGNLSFLQHLRSIHFLQQLYLNNLKKKNIYI